MPSASPASCSAKTLANPNDSATTNFGALPASPAKTLSPSPPSRGCPPLSRHSHARMSLTKLQRLPRMPPLSRISHTRVSPTKLQRLPRMPPRSPSLALLLVAPKTPARSPAGLSAHGAAVGTRAQARAQPDEGSTRGGPTTRIRRRNPTAAIICPTRGVEISIRQVRLPADAPRSADPRTPACRHKTPARTPAGLSAHGAAVGHPCPTHRQPDEGSTRGGPTKRIRREISTAAIICPTRWVKISIRQARLPADATAQPESRTPACRPQNSSA